MSAEVPAPRSSAALAWLRLLRVPLAPTAAWDAVACLALALAAGGRSLAEVGMDAWVLLAATSLLTYGFGMGLNDLADRERDRTLAPDRPLPSGRLRPVPVLLVLLVLAGGALALGGGPAGQREVVFAALALAALYDLFAKRFLVGGVVTMGLVRAANASVAVVPLVVHGWAPVWVLGGPAAIGLYAAGVTLWSTTEEADVPSRRVVARILMVLAFAGAGVLPWLAAGRFTLGVVIAFGVVTSIAFARRPLPGPPKRQVLEMLLALYFLSACLATAGDGGSMASNLVAIGVAITLNIGTQLFIRSLARAARREAAA